MEGILSHLLDLFPHDPAAPPTPPERWTIEVTRAEDMLLLHFSCHGLKNAAGELFLAGTDTVPNRLSSTAVAARFVDDELAECRGAHVALLLDCCFGGASIGSVSAYSRSSRIC